MFVTGPPPTLPPSERPPRRPNRLVIGLGVLSGVLTIGVAATAAVAVDASESPSDVAACRQALTIADTAFEGIRQRLDIVRDELDKTNSFSDFATFMDRLDAAAAALPEQPNVSNPSGDYKRFSAKCRS